MFKQQSK